MHECAHLLLHRTNTVQNYKQKGTCNREVNEEAPISDVMEHKVSFPKTATKGGLNAQTRKSCSTKLRKSKDSSKMIFDGHVPKLENFRMNLLMPIILNILGVGS